MKLSQLVGKRLKEVPKDATTPSHVFLLRGGYVRPVSTGIYSLLPLARRVTAKIEAIIREEMNAIEGQEVLMPVVLPRELWEESGRYQSVGPELLRFKDRNDKDMLLGMTHEEAVVHLARSEINSYKQLPAMVYQIQTKYRDEARPRAGLIRVREFTMKDAYSFHVDAADLEAYYKRCHRAYERIFERVGMKHVVSIESDSGMMGGSASHEFMAVADSGEDTIFLTEDGTYKANREVATTGLVFEKAAPLPLEKVHTPGAQSIEDLSAFLKIPASQTGKAVFYVIDDEKTGKEKLVFVVIRGDIEVNETKLRNHLKARELRFANDEQIRSVGAYPGYASPLNLTPQNIRIVFDRSARETHNLVVGANEKDYHFKNFCFDRDMGDLISRTEVVDIATAREGDPCPITGAPLQMKRGIEVGNIFQLGRKYTESMKFTVLDKNGKSIHPIMGCYGIGVGRAMASVIEQSHDQYGPIWPATIAPFHIHILALNKKKEGVGEGAEKAYGEFLSQGFEVLYDDRDEKPGPSFNDADLIGAPWRLVFSPKTFPEGKVEVKARDGSFQEVLPLAEAMALVKERLKAALAP